MSVRVRWSGVKGFLRAIDRVAEAVPDETEKALRASALDWERETKKRVPKVTGGLARTFRSGIERSRGTIAGICGSNDPRSLWLEFGTRAHAIRPRRARHLAFWTPGGFVRTSLVHHPGIKVGTPRNPRRGWLRRTAREKSKRFIRAGSRESMPFLRPAWLDVRSKVVKRLKGVLVAARKAAR